MFNFDTNLGTFNYDENEQSGGTNDHILQGLNFLDYGQQYASAIGNSYSLFGEPSNDPPEWGSIIEGLDGLASSYITTAKRQYDLSFNLYMAAYRDASGVFYNAKNSYITAADAVHNYLINGTAAIPATATALAIPAIPSPLTADQKDELNEAKDDILIANIAYETTLLGTATFPEAYKTEALNVVVENKNDAEAAYDALITPLTTQSSTTLTATQKTKLIELIATKTAAKTTRDDKLNSLKAAITNLSTLLSSSSASLTADQISEINTILTAYNTIRSTISANQGRLTTKLSDLATELSKQTFRDPSGNDMIVGQLEVSTLSEKSSHLYFLVYFIIFLTLLGFMLYIKFNPQPNIMAITYVLGTLSFIYAISRWIDIGLYF